jgi:hypothetical protein
MGVVSMGRLSAETMSGQVRDREAPRKVDEGVVAFPDVSRTSQPAMWSDIVIRFGWRIWDPEPWDKCGEAGSV